MFYGARNPTIFVFFGLAGCFCCMSCTNNRQTGQASRRPGQNVSLVFELHADGTLTQQGDSENAFSPEAVRKVIEDGRSAGGSLLTIAAAPDAKHGDLDSLLRTGVDCGIGRFVLNSAADSRSFAFTLDPPSPPSGLPHMDQLPPMKLRLQSDASGQLMRIALNDRILADFRALQEYLIAIIGDERGPGSVQEAAELEMNCDAALRAEHVLEAMDAATGYDAEDGSRVALVQRVYPVSWNGQVVEELKKIELLREEPLDLMLEEQVELSPAESR